MNDQTLMFIFLIGIIGSGIFFGTIVFGFIHDWRLKKMKNSMKDKCICGHSRGWHSYCPEGKLLLGDCYSTGCNCKRFTKEVMEE